jgi:hypothetical protein
MASPSRVWAFSRASRSSQAASQLSRSTIDGAAWVVNGWNGNRVMDDVLSSAWRVLPVDRVAGANSSAQLVRLLAGRGRFSERPHCRWRAAGLDLAGSNRWKPSLRLTERPFGCT